MINMLLLPEWVESEKPTYLLDPTDNTKIFTQFHKAYKEGKLCTEQQF